MSRQHTRNPCAIYALVTRRYLRTNTNCLRQPNLGNIVNLEMTTQVPWIKVDLRAIRNVDSVKNVSMVTTNCMHIAETSTSGATSVTDGIPDGNNNISSTTTISNYTFAK